MPDASATIVGDGLGAALDPPHAVIKIRVTSPIADRRTPQRVSAHDAKHYFRTVKSL
jgi:hypothetical protein